MADNSMMDSVLGWLKGSPAATPAPAPWMAPPLASYPSNDDAENARKYGFSQNSVNQPFLDNQTAHVLGKNVVIPAAPPQKGKATQAVSQSVFLPQPFPDGIGTNALSTAVDNPKLSQKADLTNPNNNTLKGNLDNIVMRAGLAANRIPIAAVGFDPSRTALDPTSGEHVTIAGLTSTKNDFPMYANTAPNLESTMVHESTHRGIEKLRQQYPDKYREIERNLPDNEMIVRFLMQSQAGDPEKGVGSAGMSERNNAINMMDTSLYPQLATKYRGAINQLQELAIDAMKNRGKRAGPQ